MPNHPFPKPRRDSPRGTLWQALGLGLMAGSLPIWIVFFALFGPQGHDYFLPVLLLGLPGVALGRYCYQQGKKYKVPSAVELLRADGRPPVLYLRSFVDDAAAAANPVWKAFISMEAWTTSMTGEEEQVAEVMNEIGPFVAIGKPGSKLPDLGAARMYVGDSEWQSTVLDLTQRCRLVVFRLGNTPGFWWEIQNVVGMIPPEKIVFLLPYGKARYEAFRRESEKYLPKPLPDFPVSNLADVVDRITAGSDGLGTLKALLYFDPDWTPHLQLLSGLSTVTRRGKKVVAHLKTAMKPVVGR